MITDKQKQILQRALDLYGHESQIQMAFGECGEFITLAGRRVQGRMKPQDMISEIADVIVMMHQMAMIHGEDKVKAEIESKLCRLNLQCFLNPESKMIPQDLRSDASLDYWRITSDTLPSEVE